MADFIVLAVTVAALAIVYALLMRNERWHLEHAKKLDAGRTTLAQAANDGGGNG